VGPARGIRPLTLDAGALIALGAGNEAVREAVRAAMAGGVDIAIPAGVLAQVWRDGRRQSWLARLVRQPRTRVEDLTEAVARAAGELCVRAGTSDVVDASLVVCARRRPGGTILTGDPDDIGRLAPGLAVRRV
jgi:predicted nucleic acid-binding protein